MSLTRIRVLALVAVSLLCSCNRGGLTEVSVDGFTVRAERSHLLLDNDRPGRVHYVALERETSHLVDLYYDPTKWPSVEAGEEKRIPLADLMGYTADAEQAIVFWWSSGKYGTPAIVVDLK
jgi:hypothetical protein